MSSAVTVSGIQSGYYFTVFDSNVGSGLTSYENALELLMELELEHPL